MSSVRLTQYSHGGGCGCKISPKVLDQILKTQLTAFHDPHLLVGNEHKDDAAVYDLGNGTSVISTTDFFMPIVDDPADFGRIAAANAISDIYAMGGKPIMAIAILGWPVNTLSTNIAQQVIDGGRSMCREAGIALAGGHSIDAPEPIFGLAVTGIVPTEYIKRNNQAQAGDSIFLTKPLGIGIFSHAEKQSKLKPEHRGIARKWMCTLNQAGSELAQLEAVSAMTDVTGFALLGHLSEMCEGADLAARIQFKDIPSIPGTLDYIGMGCTPGGMDRNFASYGHKISPLTSDQKALLCDPQTSGGLMFAVKAGQEEFIRQFFRQKDMQCWSIGHFVPKEKTSYMVEVRE
ncbi:Selenide, water dikinase [Vibrio quintilis]|uniref:Selenide, water dikinase n=2 Tax=Vibrio quintilis TaxID=1117707 RepID=A0A1M7YYC4_9VIBR|nr:Selenide, water dikinase [Vibrio quintilis]